MFGAQSMPKWDYFLLINLGYDFQWWWLMYAPLSKPHNNFNNNDMTHNDMEFQN